MRAKLLTATAAAALLAGACGDDAARPAAPEPVDLAALPGVYAGTFPCRNCPGIDVRLWLRPDGAFFMRQDYLGAAEEPAERAHATGRWTWDSGPALLSLRSAGPERAFRYRDARLTLQGPGDPHVLARAESAEPFTDRLALQGRYDSVTGAGTFAECYTGLRLPVTDDARGRDLRRRHRAVSPAASPALVAVEAHLAYAQGAEGAEFLAVDRFVSLRPGAACGRAR